MNARLSMLFALAFVIVAMPALASTQVCYNGVATIPANCTGGTITQDAISGTCRKLVCANGGNSVQALACDKPDIGTKIYFEMYKQSSSGVTPTLCIDGSCIQNNGYVKSSNYPICIGNTTSPPNGEVANVTILSDLATEQNRVFACETPFNLTAIDWYVNNTKVFHKDNTTQNPLWPTMTHFYNTFPGNGTYKVTCNATNGSRNASGSIIVNINTPLTPAEISHYQKTLLGK